MKLGKCVGLRVGLVILILALTPVMADDEVSSLALRIKRLQKDLLELYRIVDQQQRQGDGRQEILRRFDHFEEQVRQLNQQVAFRQKISEEDRHNLDRLTQALQKLEHRLKPSYWLEITAIVLAGFALIVCVVVYRRQADKIKPWVARKLSRNQVISNRQDHGAAPVDHDEDVALEIVTLPDSPPGGALPTLPMNGITPQALPLQSASGEPVLCLEDLPDASESIDATEMGPLSHSVVLVAQGKDNHDIVLACGMHSLGRA